MGSIRNSIRKMVCSRFRKKKMTTIQHRSMSEEACHPFSDPIMLTSSRHHAGKSLTSAMIGIAHGSVIGGVDGGQVFEEGIVGRS